MISNSTTFGHSFDVSQVFFILGIKSFATNNLYREFYTRHWSAVSSKGRNLGAGNCCCRVVNGLFTTVTYNVRICGYEDMCQGFSYSFDIRQRSERLVRLGGSTILKNIPTSFSGDTFVVIIYFGPSPKNKSSNQANIWATQLP